MREGEEGRTLDIELIDSQAQQISHEQQTSSSGKGIPNWNLGPSSKELRRPSSNMHTKEHPPLDPGTSWIKSPFGPWHFMDKISLWTPCTSEFTRVLVTPSNACVGEGYLNYRPRFTPKYPHPVTFTLPQRFRHK